MTFVTVCLNGEQRRLERGMTVEGLLKSLKVESALVALACNGCVVPRSTWSRVTIKEGDTLEVIHFIGGG